MAYFLYILQSEVNKSFYIGQTEDLDDRLRRHAAGRSCYTKSRGPWRLVHLEVFQTREQAVKRERELKGKHSKRFLLDLIAESQGSVG